MRGWFLTGTDTDCGKTRVAVALIHVLRAHGLRVAPFKPVAAGAEPTPEGPRNSDAEALIAAAGGDWEYVQVNPYCFAPPISPHLAAAEAGARIDLDRLVAQARTLAAGADRLVVEGAGGWLAPLGPGIAIEDLARTLSLPVLLVVGLRLGCLNHALLTAARIRDSGCMLAGWVGSVLDPGMARLERNIATLEDLLPAPCVGILPRLVPEASGAAHIDASLLEGGLS